MTPRNGERLEQRRENPPHHNDLEEANLSRAGKRRADGGGHGNPKGEISDQELGAIRGGLTGEADGDTTPGGWEGTDDATSTAPSDLSPETNRPPESALDADPDVSLGRAYAGGLATQDEGGISDLRGSPVEESRNWARDSLVEQT